MNGLEPTLLLDTTYVLVIVRPCLVDKFNIEPTLFVEQTIMNGNSRFSYYVSLSLENPNLVGDVFYFEDNNWNMDMISLSVQSRVTPCYEEPYLKHSNLVDHIVSFENVYLCEGLPLLFDHILRHVRIINFKGIDNVMHWPLFGFYCTSIKPFNGVGIFYGNLVKDFFSYGFVLYMKEFMNWCSHTSFVVILSLIEHEYGDWAFGFEHEHIHLLGVAPSFGAFSGPNLSYYTMIFDLLLLNLVGVRNQDLRTNPFQEGEDDTIMDVVRQRIHSRREPWIDWGPRRGQSHAKELSCSSKGAK